MKKLIRSIIVVLAFTMLFSMTVFAEGTGGSGTGGGGNGTGNGTVINAPSCKKTGFVFYIVDGGGNIVAEPKSAVSFNVYPDSTHFIYLKMRFGGRVMNSITNGSIQDCPAWNGLAPFNSNTSGNGGVIKNHLISNGANGKPDAINFIQFYWGESMADSFIDNDDYYLIIEPFLWSSLYRSSTYLGNACCTSIGWVLLREAYSCPEGSSNSTYILGNLPNSMAFDIPVLGTPAPTNLSDIHSYSDLKTFGYGIISVWSSELGNTPIEPEPISIENADAIKSDELNYIYKNFSGSRNNWSSFNVESIEMLDYAAHTSDTDWRMDDFEVTDNKSGDLWGFKGNNVLFYRPATGLWAESTATKTFAYDAEVFPQYSYNISRALWSDNLVLCKFYGATGNGSPTASNLRDYAKNQLGIETGNTGSVTGVSAGKNIDATYGVVKQDRYSFKGTTTEYWKEYEVVGVDDKGTEDTSDDTDTYDWVEHNNGLESSEISYTVNHYVDKYKTYDTGVVNSNAAGDIAYKVRFGGTGIPVVKAGFVTQSSDILKMFPEVAMKMYYTTQTSTYYDELRQIIVYVMGEYERKTHVPMIHTYSVGFTFGSTPQGRSIVVPATTGTNAQDLVADWERKTDKTQEYMQVMPQGGSFETGTTNNPKITVFSYALDVQDETNGEHLKSEWGNTFNGKAYHDDFVNSLANSLEVNIKMKTYDISGSMTNEYDFKDSFDISITQTKFLNEYTLNIEYMDGAVTNKSEIISKIMSYSAVSEDVATAAYDSWGLEQVLGDMLISSTDADNGSKNKFYDEEAHSLCIKIYQSNIVFGNVLLDDKADYGSSTEQNLFDITQNGKSGVQARFFMDLYFTDDYLNLGGYGFDVADMHYLIKDAEIEGSRFIVSNITTSDMRW